MIRVRRIYDDVLAVNRTALRQIETIWRTQFDQVTLQEIEALTEHLHNPLRQRFRRIVFVAEDVHGDVRGFALIFYAPEEKFCFLEYLAAAPGTTGGGFGAALYQRVREDARTMDATGLFFECAPDDPEKCTGGVVPDTNAQRLRFYERYGARPLEENEYDAPIRPGGLDMPLLVYDDLGTGAALARRDARRIVRAILERKYSGVCPAEYVERVVASFRSNPVPVRPLRYHRKAPTRRTAARRLPAEAIIALVINDRHEIHHVRERGYVEAPVRIRTILAELEKTDLFMPLAPKRYPRRHITAVHEPAFVDYLERVCRTVPAGRSVYPYVFPLRNHTRAPKELAIRAGYYCIDTFTPLNRNAFLAAKRAVDCALTAADALLVGRRVAYALVRPPGHHAERRAFGGFCYFNSGAVAAHHLAAQGRVAILDVDYHHGNGQQDIFYERDDVLTVSIHGHPAFAYPYFTGFEDERGEGPGLGFNINVALPEKVESKRYLKVLDQQLTRIRQFAPTFLVLALGFDPAKGDPTGTWSLLATDFRVIGRAVGALGVPLLVIQEGGYLTRTLGTNARSFFEGIAEGLARV